MIRCGGDAIARFSADEDFTGGLTATNYVGPIVRNVTDPAPAEVYQSERYGKFSYAIPGLTPGKTYLVRLHFCENYCTAPGQPSSPSPLMETMSSPISTPSKPPAANTPPSSANSPSPPPPTAPSPSLSKANPTNPASTPSRSSPASSPIKHPPNSPPPRPSLLGKPTSLRSYGCNRMQPNATMQPPILPHTLTKHI